ncbi:MAG: TonB family protein [Hyphomicrobiaceae bacterium]|nr:TonB family protein [Hyphomicrobiaceae bacterium]
MDDQDLTTTFAHSARPTEPSLASLARGNNAGSTRRGSWTFPAALIGAFGLHLSLVAATQWMFRTDGTGGGIVLDAIAVTITDGKAFEARDIAVANDGATTTQPFDVSTQTIAQPENSAAASASTDHTKAQDATILTTQDATRSEPVAPPAPKVDTTMFERNSDAPEVPAAQAVQQSVTASNNDARGAEAPSAATSAAQAAPPGMANAYARSVLSAVTKTRPKSLGAQGSAHVRFTVGADGSVTDAKILTTSGNTLLDTAAIKSVQRAQFPAPPMALSRADTTFVLPFHFR